jgi:hypothetical protein
MEEIWKDIPGYKGLYHVSDFGRVKSFRKLKEKILKPSICTGGYYVITIRTYKKIRVHQLVAMAFLNHKPTKMKSVIDHINSDKLDNRVENLQVISQRSNTSKKQGVFTSKYTGVSWSKDRNKWRAQININGKTTYLGVFNCELAASLAYQNKLKEILC